MIRIVIIDDHKIVIDGLRLLLAGEPDFYLVKEFTNGLEFLEQFDQLNADVILCDVMMPILDGYMVSKEVRKLDPWSKIIILSMNSEGDLAEKLIGEVKVNGYILKTAGKKELHDAIRLVNNGETYYDELVLSNRNDHLTIVKENDVLHLTHREVEIVNCIANNLTNKQIADTLYISERTVETHRKNIFRKTNTHTALALIEFAKRRRIIAENS